MLNPVVSRVIEELVAQRLQIDAAITALRSTTDSRSPLRVTADGPVPVVRANGARSPMSMRRRKAISRRMKAVWSRKRKEAK